MTRYWLWQGHAGGGNRTFLFVVEDEMFEWMEENADQDRYSATMGDAVAIYIRKLYPSHHNWGIIDRIAEVTYRVYTETTDSQRGVFVVHLSPADLEV